MLENFDSAAAVDLKEENLDKSKIRAREVNLIKA